jgi:hypothetical protein
MPMGSIGERRDWALRNHQMAVIMNLALREHGMSFSHSGNGTRFHGIFAMRPLYMQTTLDREYPDILCNPAFSRLEDTAPSASTPNRILPPSNVFQSVRLCCISHDLNIKWTCNLSWSPTPCVSMEGVYLSWVFLLLRPL